MISPRQIRAARGLLGWSRGHLADKAIVSIQAIANIERGDVDPRVSTIQSVERVFLDAGIEFLPAAGGRGEGLRMQSPFPDERPIRKKRKPPKKGGFPTV